MTTIANISTGLATGIANPQSPERAQLAKAATDFEAIFVRQMLASARKASEASGGDQLFGNDAANTFRDMQDAKLADTMAQSGSLGLAKMIEAHLARVLGDAPATDAGATNTGPTS